MSRKRRLATTLGGLISGGTLAGLIGWILFSTIVKPEPASPHADLLVTSTIQGLAALGAIGGSIIAGSAQRSFKRSALVVATSLLVVLIATVLSSFTPIGSAIFLVVGAVCLLPPALVALFVHRVMSGPNT